MASWDFADGCSEPESIRTQAEGLKYFRHKLRQAPDNASYHRNLAPLLVSEGQLTKAIHHYRRAIELNPADCSSKNDIGVCLWQLGKWEAALAAFVQVTRERPDFTAAHVNMSAVYFGRGMLVQALQHARQAVHLAPMDARAHRNLAKVLDATGDSTCAMAHRQIAVLRGPGSRVPPKPVAADIQVHRALAVQLHYHQQGDVEGAHACMDAARALEGKHVVLPNSETTWEIVMNARLPSA
ncbi:hypothetical protein JKP88DRAFT_257957 [Tribonema minus]|uniref:Tetratricopeptide repeat protein n=1 Tax=Tribonema minus TaxID=303371 RepID=A0A835YUT1_9STRA|nr:hypothetical protein JKP88DRAFT_257957 [Tribonema minus]